MNDTILTRPIANPCDHEWTDNLFCFYFGAYGWTQVYVWANHLEDGLEIACDWLAENAPGIFTTFDKDDYLDACENDDERAIVESMFSDEPGDCEEWYSIAERAEVDHSIIGHTTYEIPGMPGPHFLSSCEWNVREVS